MGFIKRNFAIDGDCKEVSLQSRSLIQGGEQKTEKEQGREQSREGTVQSERDRPELLV